MLYQEKLKEICIFCESKINSVKESESFFEKPFKHAVIDNFLPNKFADLALKSFPSSHDPFWEHTNDEGIESNQDLLGSLSLIFLTEWLM